MRYSLLLALGLAACSPKSDSDDEDDDDDAGDDTGLFNSDGSDGGDGDGGDGDDGGSTSDYEGRAYALDLVSANWVEPAGVGELLGSLVGDVQLLLGVDEAGGGDITFIASTTNGSIYPEQDPCTATASLEGALDGDHFSVRGDSVTMGVSGTSVTLDDLGFEGDFEDDGIDGASLEADLDVRGMADLFGSIVGTDDPYEICDFLTAFGVSCGACADGEDLCIAALIEDIRGEEVDTTVSETDGCR